MISLSLTQLLQKTSPKAIVDWPENADKIGLLDLSKANKRLAQVALSDELSFSQFIEDEMKLLQADMLVGGYLEHRMVYRRSAVFAGRSERSIHLGVDIWAGAGTAVYAPLDGTIHSFRDNAQFGDYGPTLILKHSFPSAPDRWFFTLYGHLSRNDMPDWQVGKPVIAGDKIASFGAYHENGDWPPHLHFQIIEDVEGLSGDYPGVCAADGLEHYQANCPDPNVLLRLSVLDQKKSTALP